MHSEQVKGCCMPPPCVACAAARSYTRVYEDSIEQNVATYSCCCCSVTDGIRKHYLDVHPFKPACCDLITPKFYSYKDAMYCCFIPCSCTYDCCCKPCWGEMVMIYYCFDCCPETICVKCFGMARTPLICGLADSQAFAGHLAKQAAVARGDESLTGGAPTTAEMVRDTAKIK